MIGTLAGIILVVALVGVIWWGVQKILAVTPIAEPFRTIVYVLCVVLGVVIAIWVILQLLGIAGIAVPHWR